MKLLIINTGGTSTKIGYFDGTFPVPSKTVRHSLDELVACPTLWDQYDLRKKAILGYLEEAGIAIHELDAIVSRGPAVKPVVSGVYAIDNNMIDDARSRKYGNHPCAIGCLIAFDMADGKIPALTVDPPCVDEMLPVSRYTGLPEISRRSFFQALNHKAVARRFAQQMKRSYEELNLVISHLGSGISVASHAFGKVIDVTNGLDGDAPFGLDRTGTLPAADWMNFCLSGKHTDQELHAILNGKGGMMAHLGTNDAFEIERRITAGDKKAEEVYAAMAFQVGKGIGAAAAALKTRPDGILLTGGLANSKMFTEQVRQMVEWMAPVHIFAGEDEILALTEGALRGLNGEVPILTY